MIAVRIIGGLGNQMFQYACGRALARKHGTRLILDVRGFAEQKLRRFDLNHFNIQAETGTDETLPTIAQTRSPLVRLLAQWYRPAGLRIIRDYKWIFYDPRASNSGSELYLDGYWQTEKYFKDIASLIREDFTLREPLDATNQKMVETVKSQPSVSLHVRRGDYINNPVYTQCTLEYYQRALQYIQDRRPNVHVYVFSDDPGWVQKNLISQIPTTYVTQNSDIDAYKDLHLMSQCHHHITANSSFSWWGAWLGTDPNGIVIAPNAWYTDPAKHTRDLLPPSWIQLPL